VDKVELGQVFHGVIRFSPDSIIHSLLFSYVFIQILQKKHRGTKPGKIQSTALPDMGQHKALNTVCSLLYRTVNSTYSSRRVSGRFEGAENGALVFMKDGPNFCPILLICK
jgi:hypothetical protein